MKLVQLSRRFSFNYLVMSQGELKVNWMTNKNKICLTLCQRRQSWICERIEGEHASRHVTESGKTRSIIGYFAVKRRAENVKMKKIFLGRWEQRKLMRKFSFLSYICWMLISGPWCTRDIECMRRNYCTSNKSWTCQLKTKFPSVKFSPQTKYWKLLKMFDGITQISHVWKIM